MSGVCSLFFEEARITLSATGMCFASLRRLEVKWDTALRAPGEPHFAGSVLETFPNACPHSSTTMCHISNIAEGRVATHKGPNATKHWKICNCKQIGLQLVIPENPTS